MSNVKLNHMNLKWYNTTNDKNCKRIIDCVNNNNYTSYHTILLRHNSNNKSNNGNAKTLRTNIVATLKLWKKHIFDNNSGYHKYIINNSSIKSFARVKRNNDNKKLYENSN